MKEPATLNPFALYNPAGDLGKSSEAVINHSGLRTAKPVSSCVGVKALQLSPRPQSLIFALLDKVATESAVASQLIYPALTTSTLNQKVMTEVERGSPGDTLTLHVVNSAGLQPADLLMLAPYGEQFWVTAVPTSTSIDVLRVGNFPSAKIKKGAILMHVGNAVPEGSMRRLGHYTAQASYISSSFIVRNGWSETGTVAALKGKAGFEDLVLSKDRPGMIIDHGKDINKILLYGQGFKTMRNGLPFTMGDGIISAVRLCAPQNIINIAAPITLRAMGRIVQNLSKVLVEGGVENKLQVYCDWTSYEAWQELGEAENGIRINTGTDTIGLVFSTFVVGGSTIEVIYDEEMNDRAVTEGISEGFMFFFNPPSVVIDYLPGRRGLTASYKGMDAGESADFNSADIKAESILSEFHVLHKAPHANGIITGFNVNMIKRKPHLLIGDAPKSYFEGECKVK